jgi:hypothetical protein
LLDYEHARIAGVKDMTTHAGFWLTSLVFGLLLPLPLNAGQGVTQVPIHGLTGTIATPESVHRFYTDLNKGLEKTGDAFDRVGRKSAKADSDVASFERVRPGTPVAVRYTVKGLAASDTEGIVTSVDRSRKRITIRFADGAMQTLRASEHPMHGGRVIVFYPDESGQNAPHYFKPSS